MANVFINHAKSPGYVSVRFNYDPAAIELFKLHITGRRWSQFDKAWNVPLTEHALDDIQRLFNSLNYKVYINEDVRKVLSRQQEQARENKEEKKLSIEATFKPELFEFYTAPMEHQKKALAMMTGNECYALFMEQGTGKTKVMLDFISALKKYNKLSNPCLVISPTSVLDVWKDEALKHQPGLKVCVLDGSVSSKAEQFRAVYDTNDIIVLNYESTWREPLYTELARHRYGCMVLDESTRIMHHTSKQAKACLKLGKLATRRFVLTGTPAPNGPLNLYNQLKFLNTLLVGPSFYAFRDRYVVLGGFQNHTIIGYKNEDELRNIIGSVSFRVKKEDCLDLPPKIYEVEKVELEGRQRKIYDKLKEELIAEVEAEKFVSAPNALARLVRLRQISAGFAATDDGLFEFADSAKIKWLKEFLSEHKKEKIVIWGSFIKELDLISKALEDKNIKYVKFNGETPINTRAGLIKAFQEDANTRVFLSTAKAGGLGITLTAASIVVFMSNDFSGELRMQAEDRAHRVGQKQKVLYIDLIAKNTVDNSIHKMLLKKKQLNDSLSAGNFRAIAEGISDEEPI